MLKVIQFVILAQSLIQQWEHHHHFTASNCITIRWSSGSDLLEISLPQSYLHLYATFKKLAPLKRDTLQTCLQCLKTTVGPIYPFQISYRAGFHLTFFQPVFLLPICQHSIDCGQLCARCQPCGLDVRSFFPYHFFFSFFYHLDSESHLVPNSQLSLLHITRGPGSKGEVGWDTPAARHPKWLLDVRISERIDDWVDHWAAGGWKDRGVGVYYGIAGVCHNGVHGKRQPACPKGTQDGWQRGDPFGGRNSQELMLHCNLLRMAKCNLADLKIKLHHQGKDQEESDGKCHSIVFGDWPTDAACCLVP